MPLDIVHKSFIMNRASGNQTITGMDISGKAFIFYTVGSSGNTLASRGDDYYTSIGFAEIMTSGNTIVTQTYAAMSDKDAVGTSQTDRMQGRSGMICLVDSDIAATTPERRGSMNQVSGTAFQINWTNISTDAAEATSGYVNVDIFGGSDIVNARVGTFVAQSGHGTQSVSGVGFSGNVLFFASARITQASMDAAIPLAVGSLSFGVVDGGNVPTDQGLSVLSEETATTADTWRTQRATRSLLFINDTGTVVSQAQVTAFTANGFDIEWTSGTGALGETVVNYLAMNISGEVHVSEFDLVSGTGNMSTSGIGFSGKYAMLFSYGTRGGTATVQSHNRISIGSATSGTQRGCIWCGSEDTPTNMVTARNLDASAIINLIDETATGSSSTVMLNADFVNFHSDGITLNRITNAFSGDMSGAAIGYLVIGDIITAPPVVAVEDVNRRAFGAGKINATYMQDFGTFQSVNSNSRAVFGPPKIWNPFINVSGSLI